MRPGPAADSCGRPRPLRSRRRQCLPALSHADWLCGHQPCVLFQPGSPVSPTQGCARLSPAASFPATGSRLMRAGDVPAPVRVASTTFRPAVLWSGAPAWGGVSGLGSHGCRVAFCLPTHRGVQFRSTRAMSATGWARCAGRGSGSHCARPLRVAPGRRARACRPRPWNRCAGEILLR